VAADDEDVVPVGAQQLVDHLRDPPEVPLALRSTTRTQERWYSPSTASMGRANGVASTTTCSRTRRGSGISS
jgi:hypothetical protein